MRDYKNLKDIVVTEEREKIMDIYFAAWEDCRNMGHCKDCPDRQMPKEKFSILECFALKYSRMLIEAGYTPVVHGEWLPVSDDDQYEGEYYCSVCNAEQFFPENAPFAPFCWRCGAKMDGGKEK